MATIHVRSVPDALYAQVRELAQAKQRSLSAEVGALLETAVAIEERRQKQANALDANSVALLRVDRVFRSPKKSRPPSADQICVSNRRRKVSPILYTACTEGANLSHPRDHAPL